MAIPAIGALPSIPKLPSISATGAPEASGAVDFAKLVGNGIENLQATQANADQLATQAATGKLTDLHDYMIASTQASLTTELTVAVRNRAVEAFNDVMRMQL
jgi:flagellar hook-basal body complex protein FliE